MPRTRVHPLTLAVGDTLDRLGLAGSSGLLAVSGGADSMALMHACAQLARRLSLTLEVATVEHGLRPEAAAEIEAVASAARGLGLCCHVRKVEVGRQPGIEARARTLREAALEAVRGERGLSWVATAHTANDQAETVLMRLGRGAGLRGAAAILERKGPFVRPMLGVTRAQVLEALAEWGVPYVVDPMNSDPAFLRVRVRARLLPELEGALGREALLHLAEFARIPAEDDAALWAQAQDARERLTLSDGSVDAVGIRALLPALRARVLVSLLEREGIELTSDRVQAVERALLRGTHTALGRERSVRVEGGALRFVRRLAVEAPEYQLTPGATVHDGASGLELQLQAAPRRDAWSLPISEDALPLTVRRRLPGDRLQLPGGGTAKLQDLLVDAKVPVERRGRLPVIVSASGSVLGVAGTWPRTPAGSGRWHLVAC